MSNYDAIDPLDHRYYDEAVAKLLSEEAHIATQAKVEAALAETLADYKICQPSDAEAIRKAAQQVTAAEVYTEEQKTKHNVKALVNCIKAKVGPNAGAYVHFGATSYDIISTALALQYRDATQQLIIPRLKSLVETLIELSEEYSETVQVGRTHGQHAVPITFGLALAQFVSRLGESTKALEELSNNLPGKFSGATGSYNALSAFVNDPLQFEADVLAKVGLKPSQASTQIAPADSLVRIFDEMTIASGIMSNLAHDMRNLQRSEIAEVREKFEEGQTGSSTMAHKRNPWNFENVASLHKQVLAQNLNAQLNLSSEHQRDLTDSASSRFYPILVGCVAEMARRLGAVMGKIEVDEDAMKRNLEMSGGAIAAEPAYLLLAKSGASDAHEKIKELAIKAQDNKQTLAEAIKSNLPDFWNGLTPEQQQIIAEPEKYYTGQAAAKTRRIVESWKVELN